LDLAKQEEEEEEQLKGDLPWAVVGGNFAEFYAFLLVVTSPKFLSRLRECRATEFSWRL
jgi:hypothetical protein